MTQPGQPGEPEDRLDFSIVLGGPLYQFFLRFALARPPVELVYRRIIACIFITWLPLALLSAGEGHFLGGSEVSFMSDIDTHARLLLAVPLLILAEPIVHLRLRMVVGQFLERGLIASQDQRRFEAIVRSTWRLRNSVIAEIVILVLAFTVGYWLWRSQFALSVATWYAAPAKGYTWAGYWYALVSLPIGRFFLLRWYFRLFIWYGFLWRVSRLQLALNPLHPDRAGGLGFLEHSLSALLPIFLAHTFLLAGLIGGQIWHEGARLPEFWNFIFAVIASLMFAALAPLAFPIFQMARAKRMALHKYGRLASRYVSEFQQKWINGGTAPEELLGNADFQSLADLANSFDVVREMRLVPFGKGLVMRLAVAMALPLLPLTLTMFPLEEMLDRLIHMLV